MNRAVFAALALALTAGSSIAADLPSHKAPPPYIPPPPIMTWTGFYAGLNLGGGFYRQQFLQSGLERGLEQRQQQHRRCHRRRSDRL